MNAKPKTAIKQKVKAVASAPCKAVAKLGSSSKSNVPKAIAKPNHTPVVPKLTKPASHAKAAPSPTIVVVPAPRDNKQSLLIASLRSDHGLTIEEMMLLTGWQAHSVRGVISGALRKRLGLNVVTSPMETSKARRYRIVDQVTV